ATLAKAGQTKASMCLGCHGIQGEGKGQFPRLAGQHPNYLVSQLTNFKNGSRKSGPMQGVVSSLSDQDYKELAAYFGSL
ncbi:MAG: cytochrome c, partial [Methylobacter sp.]|nr:cytochrome c [Methylobacter sp.]